MPAMKQTVIGGKRRYWGVFGGSQFMTSWPEIQLGYELRAWSVPARHYDRADEDQRLANSPFLLGR